MVKEQSILSKDFPEKLRNLRQGRRWSQAQLAQKIGADPNRISRYERGVIWPTLELVVKIAEIFEVTTDYLIRDGKELAVNKISNQELLKRIEALNSLPEEDQTTVIAVLDAFIKKCGFEKVAFRDKLGDIN